MDPCGLILALGLGAIGNLPDQGGPLTAHNIGNHKKRTPVIGNAIHKLAHIGVGCGKLDDVIGNPTGGLSRQLLQMGCPVTPEALNSFTWLAAPQSNPDGAVI
jgi:hypothetical protein